MVYNYGHIFSHACFLTSMIYITLIVDVSRRESGLILFNNLVLVVIKRIEQALEHLDLVLELLGSHQI